MAYVILVLILIVALLLGAVILVQNPKGGGLASGFESAGKIGGVQRTTDFLEKATWYLTVALFVLSMASSGFYGTGTSASGFSEDEFVAPVADPVAPATAPAQAPATDPAPAN
jgi:preprotein translocase subunit SecG